MVNTAIEVLAERLQSVSQLTKYWRSR